MGMHFDFDTMTDRRNTNCGKWDTMDKKYGREGMIHLGVADMDFRAPAPILDGLRDVLDMGVLGYTDLSDKFYESIQRWYLKQYGLDTAVTLDTVVRLPDRDIYCDSTFLIC